MRPGWLFGTVAKSFICPDIRHLAFPMDSLALKAILRSLYLLEVFGTIILYYSAFKALVLGLHGEGSIASENLLWLQAAHLAASKLTLYSNFNSNMTS